MAIDLNDKSGNGYTLTNSSATEYTADLPFAQSTVAIEVDNASTQYLYTNNAVINPLADYTIEFWVKLTAEIASGTWEFVHIENNTAKHVIYVKYQYNGGTRRLYFQQDKWVVVGYQATHNVSLGTTWHHIAMRMTSRVIQIYLDGTAVGTTATFTVGDYSTGDTTTNNQVVIGAGTNVGSGTIVNKADAKIDEVRIWNTSVSATNINNNKAVELSAPVTNLQAYYPFDTLGSPSPSLSPSLSPSASASPSSSISLSISKSPSSSVSPSSSISPSPSVSVSLSPSSSLSPSLSRSLSPSLSFSPSPSVSRSLSPSASVSQSLSISLSPSLSISLSPSLSASLSVSPSPSPGYEDYTRGNYAVLPTDDADLEVAYSAQDYIDVATSDNVRVGQDGTSQHMLHEFKNFAGGQSSCQLHCELQSTLAPNVSTVYLQVYNQNSTTWETVDSDSTSPVNTDFHLIAEIADLTNYLNGLGNISCRVYQEGM